MTGGASHATRAGTCTHVEDAFMICLKIEMQVLFGAAGRLRRKRRESTPSERVHTFKAVERTPDVTLVKKKKQKTGRTEAVLREMQEKTNITGYFTTAPSRDELRKTDKLLR